MSKSTQISLKRSEVPEYLQASELYLSLDTSADLEVTVPSDCVKQDLVIASVADFQHLLQTMRFWSLRAFPAQLVEFLITVRSAVFRRNARDVTVILSDFEDDFPDTCALVKQLNICCEEFHSEQASDICAVFGRIDFLDYFLGYNKPLTINTLNIAAVNGHLPFLKYVYQRLSAFDDGHFLDQFDCSRVVMAGHAECLKFLVCRGAPLYSDLLVRAIEYNSLSCLTYLLDAVSIRDSWVTVAAAGSQDVRLLRCAVEHSCLLDEEAWLAAAANSNTASLAYLIQSHPEVQCDTQQMLSIAARGCLPVLEMLHPGYFAFTADLVAEAAKAGNMVCLEFLYRQCDINYWLPATMAALAGAGHLYTLKAFHEQGCPWDDSAPIAAVRGGQARCLVYLIQQRGVPQSAEFTAVVAGAGRPIRGVLQFHAAVGQEVFQALPLHHF